MLALIHLGFEKTSGHGTLTSLLRAVVEDEPFCGTEPKHFAIDGLIALFQSIRKARRRINPNLEIKGIVLTLVDRRTNLAKDVCADLRKSYGKALRIYKTEIPVNTRTAESVSSGHSVLTYDPNCAGSLAYQALAKEVLNHERTRTESAIAR